ncbi:MAG TPA: PIG-L deacetylase family protein [Chloroflexota bacterium]|nr:PIG-L deacetylase family protein [Chloroflexota bacterium]
METPTAKRAMCIVAHADDIEFSSAGTVAKWVKQGWEVIYVICTDSSKGSEDPDMTPRELAKLRMEEQRAAAAVVGVQEVVFLGRTDGELADDQDLRRDLVRLIRKWKPERVICGDPSMRYAPDGYVNHPDHIAAADAALAAVYPFARNRPTFPELLAEGLEPHKVAEVYMWGWRDPNYWEDIEETFELKLKALREHKSQLGDWDPEEMMREWARRSGAGQLLEYAESYRRLKLG